MNIIKKISTWVVSILVLIFGIIFTLLNPEFVAINLGFKIFSVPLVLLVLLIFATGLLLGLLAGFSRAYFLYRKKDREEVAVKLNM